MDQEPENLRSQIAPRDWSLASVIRPFSEKNFLFPLDSHRPHV